MKILLVDDSIDQRRLLRKVMDKHGHEVFEAGDGAEGLDKAVSMNPDIILSDTLMPVMDGFTFLRKCKRRYGLKDKPFILYSAVYTGTKEKELALAIGAAAFVLLPKKPDEFFSEVEFALDTLSLRKAMEERPLVKEEEEYLRDYSRIVASKLEEKFTELEAARARIEEDEKRYRALFNGIRDAIIVADSERKILGANQPALREVFGYETDEVRGRNSRMLYAGDAWYEKAGQKISSIPSEGKEVFEADLRKKNGEIFSGEITAMQLLDDKGIHAGTIGLVKDITEKKTVEKENLLLHSIVKALSVSPDFQAALGDTLRLVCDMTGWKCAEAWVPSSGDTHLLCSPAWYCRADCEGFRSFAEGMTFRPGEGLPGRVWASREPTWDRDVAADPLFRRAREAAQAGIKAGMAIPVLVEDRAVTVMIFYSDDVRDRDEKLVKSISVIAAQLGVIFQRKMAEDALRESAEQLRQLTENIKEVFWMTDPLKERMLYVSPVYESVWGRSRESLYGAPQSWIEAIHPEDRGRVREALFGQSVGEYSQVYRIIRPDKTVRWIRDRAFPIKNEAGVVYRIAGIAEDITEEKRLQDQLSQAQKMEAIGEIAGGVAHDFNNILTGIMGFSNVIQMKLPQDDPLLHDVDQILSISQKAATLTHSLLAFSRQKTISPEPVNIVEIIEAVKKLLSRVIREDIELRAVFKNDFIVVNADIVQIDQVLINLATNARDAMPHGGVLTIEVEKVGMDDEFVKAHGFGKSGEYALVSVSDTGDGIDEKTRERIFEPFFTTKEVGKGTGLGLAIVYGIVRQHGGFIYVYSEKGKGTTFRIYLPAIGAVPKAKTEAVHERPRGGGETLLLAEDNSEVREIIRTILDEFGYNVIEAVDGEDAVQKFKENTDKIVLVILDVIMPKKNGKEAYDEIKRLSGGMKTLFMSGYTADIMQPDSQTWKNTRFISKPVLPTELLRSVRQMLEEKTA